MINPPWFNDPIERTAFNAMAFTMSQLDSVADQLIADAYASGNGVITLDQDCFSPAEIEYLTNAINRRVN